MIRRGVNTKHNYKGVDGESLVNIFKYRQPFVFHFHYCHMLDGHNNRRNSPISLDRTRKTKFCTDRNFSCYLDVTEVNTALASGHCQNGGNIMPTLSFWRHLVIQRM